MSDSSEPTGLGAFGVRSRTPVRDQAYNDDGHVCCPECGKVVEATAGTQRIAKPTILDDFDADDLIVHGYRCDRHTNPPVIPSLLTDVSGDWHAVTIELTSGFPRPVPVPEQEVSERVE